MILAPPAAYDHPYPGIVVEQRLSRREIAAICGDGVLACSWAPLAPGGKCFVWLPKNASRLLRSHEMAHCAGWKH